MNELGRHTPALGCPHDRGLVAMVALQKQATCGTPPYAGRPA